MCVRKEAVLSSQIEGTQSSLQDLLAAEAQILAPDTPADVDEVVNYVSAMNYGLERLRDILLKPVLYLSHYFKQYRTEYYEHLQAIRDHGQWEQWLLFFLRGVASVSRESTDTVRRILVLREEHRAAVTAHLGRAAGNGLRVLESLYQRPIVVAQVQELTGTTFAAANSLVARLAKLGILQEATGYKRTRVFRYAPYIAIFGDHPPAASSEFQGEQP
jgi:Fic family protein